jgi:hypothetical protein
MTNTPSLLDEFQQSVHKITDKDFTIQQKVKKIKSGI